jgi:hypothetical protein
VKRAKARQKKKSAARKAPEEDDVPPREMARRAHVAMANTPGAAS